MVSTINGGVVQCNRLEECAYGVCSVVTTLLGCSALHAQTHRQSKKKVSEIKSDQWAVRDEDGGVWKNGWRDSCQISMNGVLFARIKYALLLQAEQERAWSGLTLEKIFALHACLKYFNHEAFLIISY